MVVKLTEEQADYLKSFRNDKKLAFCFIGRWGFGYNLKDGNEKVYGTNVKPPFTCDEKEKMLNAIINGYEVIVPKFKFYNFSDSSGGTALYYAGKENVIIYDYVDNHITMFNNMYMKRLKAYKQIGYEIAGDLHNDKQTANAIYDGDNYAENYHKDLLDANKNIIISSPAISGTKVYELINLLKEKQLSGVQITIVTWAPDSYGFGDASYWMQLHEEMRKAGFYIKTVEESCERFAVIDQEVVWYGNINLLAKDKVDDSIMRVLSKEIASELMEITFGDNG